VAVADSIASQITMELAVRNWNRSGGDIAALPAIMPHRNAKQPKQAEKQEFTSDGVFNPALKVKHHPPPPQLTTHIRHFS